MPDILQLEDFYVMRLSATWHALEGPIQETVEMQNTLKIDYDVLRRNDDPCEFAMRFRLLNISRREGRKAGYEIDADVFGLFRFPDSLSEDEMQKLVRLNGTVILYGILRGEVAAFTGSFPGRKFMLPAVYMPDVVEKIENRKKATMKAATKQTVSEARTAGKSKRTAKGVKAGVRRSSGA